MGKPVLCSRIPPHEETVSLYGAQSGVHFFDLADPESLVALLSKDRRGELTLARLQRQTREQVAGRGTTLRSAS